MQKLVGGHSCYSRKQLSDLFEWGLGHVLGSEGPKGGSHLSQQESLPAVAGWGGAQGACSRGPCQRGWCMRGTSFGGAPSLCRPCLGRCRGLQAAAQIPDVLALPLIF